MKVSVLLIIITIVNLAKAVNWSKIREKYLYIGGSSDNIKRSEAIVGGYEAKLHQFPWQVGMIIRMKNGEDHFCGGSLISKNYVLTAAHCVDGAKIVEVILGAQYIKEKENTQIRMNTTDFIVHKRWCSFLIVNDIALVKLPKPATLNENIQLIKLVPYSEVQNKFRNQVILVSGWGLDSDSAQGISPVLRYVNSTVIPNFQCSLSYMLLLIRKSHICATGKDGKSSCSGDSGGPLIAEINGEIRQVGLVSFGRVGGCEKGYPHVYTRLTSFLKWIQQNSDVKID